MSGNFLGFEIGSWFRTLWRGRNSMTSEKDKVDRNLTLAFLAYLGVGIFGFNFPLVEHGAGLLIGVTPALLWISLISALLCAVAFTFYIQRFKEYLGVMMGILTFIIFLIFNGAYVTLFNGLADFKPAQKRVTCVVSKKFNPGGGKSRPNYLLFLRDWNDPQTQVRLQTDSALYNQTAIGDAIELQIKPGALGMEWIQDARRATF